MTTAIATAATSATSSSFAGSGSISVDKYRGAVVEDLQLPPAFSVSSNEAISRAIEQAYERDFSFIPSRRPLGYLDLGRLKQKWEAGEAGPDDKVSSHMIKFRRTSSEPYTLITPLTPLLELEVFLSLDREGKGKGFGKENEGQFALVTDQNRKFVLAVATRHDLENFVSRRGL